MKISFLVIVLNIQFVCFSQIPRGFLFAKSYSKEISLYKAKEYLVKYIFDSTKEPIKFQVRPIDAANSGELTTLIYESKEQFKSGLLLVFYGDYWNNSGVNYTGYGFKAINKIVAINMLDKVLKVLEENKKDMDEDNDEFNITYKESGLIFIIYRVWGASKIRVFFEGFDSEWDSKSVIKTLTALKAGKNK